MNYSRFINSISAARFPSPIRRLTEIQAAGGPDLISFGTGAPNVSLFPFQSIDVSLRDGNKFKLEGALLNRALQYCPTPGIPELLEWLKRLQKHLHNPPTLGVSGNSSLDMVITPGSQDGLCKIFEMALSPNDFIVIEEPTYPGTLAALKAIGVRFLSVAVDSNGIRPDLLRGVLSRWTSADANNPASDVPKILYLQPNASNPCGVSIPTARRKQIYEIAREYNLMIIEDDPYYFLQFSKEKSPSFLSMDVDGRVLRLDSFSKVLSSGIRLGFVTGPKQLIERIILHLQVSSMHCSTLSQVLAVTLLQQWSMDGFLQHTDRVAKFYETQCGYMTEAADRHLKGLCQWTVPQGGMFLWLKALGIADTSEMINQKALEMKVILATGNAFNTDSTQPSPYMRASFSQTSREQIDENVRSEPMKQLISALKHAT